MTWFFLLVSACHPLEDQGWHPDAEALCKTLLGQTPGHELPPLGRRARSQVNAALAACPGEFSVAASGCSDDVCVVAITPSGEQWSYTQADTCFPDRRRRSGTGALNFLARTATIGDRPPESIHAICFEI